MECSETQVATSSVSLIDKHKCSVLFLAHRIFMHIIIRPLCNSPNKTLYDVTFACRFWGGKQMIACEQIRLRAGGLSRLGSLAFSLHKKSA